MKSGAVGCFSRSSSAGMDEAAGSITGESTVSVRGTCQLEQCSFDI